MDFLHPTNSSFDATVWYTWILRASAPWLSNLTPIREAVDSHIWENGSPARRSEPDWRKEGAYLNRYVTDEQRRRRPMLLRTRVPILLLVPGSNS
jgi:hypothetical protein